METRDSEGLVLPGVPAKDGFPVTSSTLPCLALPYLTLPYQPSRYHSARPQDKVRTMGRRGTSPPRGEPEVWDVNHREMHQPVVRGLQPN